MGKLVYSIFLSAHLLLWPPCIPPNICLDYSSTWSWETNARSFSTLSWAYNRWPPNLFIPFLSIGPGRGGQVFSPDIACLEHACKLQAAASWRWDGFAACLQPNCGWQVLLKGKTRPLILLIIRLTGKGTSRLLVPKLLFPQFIHRFNKMRMHTGRAFRPVTHAQDGPTKLRIHIV